RCSGSTPFRTEGGAPTPKPGSHRGRCSYVQIGILLHQNRDSSRTVGAPAPRAKVFWFDSLSHRGRCSYIQIGILLHPNRGSPRTVGAPAPGAKVLDRGSGGQSASGAPP